MPMGLPTQMNPMAMNRPKDGMMMQPNINKQESMPLQKK
jgi:hypothetical protein